MARERTGDGEPEVPVRRGRGRPRDPRTDQRILSAAAELMLLRGFEATTVDDVAERAGVGKATVYRRWPSKEDLAVAAMETLYATEIPEPDTGSVVGDLTASYRAALEFVNTPEGAAFLRTAVSESVRDDRIAALHRAAVERTEARHRVTLVRAVERGEVRRDADIETAVQWLGGLLSLRVLTRRPLPSVEEADMLVASLLRGIATAGTDLDVSR
jgi:AcrR family transcriptional regulator